MNDSITSPFNTAIPERAINPTAAEIERGMSLNHKANTPPVSAKGTPLNMIRASFIELNAMTSSVKITNNVAGTTMDNLCVALSSCSNVPPYSSQ